MNLSPYSTITELVRGIRSKEISPLEVLQSHLDRIREFQPTLNAFVHLDEVGARTAAQRAENAAQAGKSIGPLHGIPLTLKSSIDVAGWRCPAGSVLRKDYIPVADAPLVARLKAAGAILLGNTNTPEFLMAYESNNVLSGKTSNPWRLSHSAGGSSGGEGAAIASGCSAGGIGSDGGGSVRIPAHFCGICALKPTPGRIPSTGHFPPSAGAIAWLGVVGPMARTIGDLRALFAVVTGADPGDALSAPVPVRPASESPSGDLRIGILEGDGLGSASPETRSAVRLAVQLLANDGFRLAPIRLAGLDRAIDLWWFFFGPVVAHLFHQTVAGYQDVLSPMFREYLSRAQPEGPLRLDEFLEACAERDVLRANILTQMQKVDALLSPVSSGPAFMHGEGTWRPGNQQSYRDTMRYSQWLNLAGLPGVSLPMALSSDGLPIGVQIVGHPHTEELILDVAERLEQLRGAFQRPPLA
jgi:Asp-tRNA(Asn)/Glu-tRNA(Gln) amidotransferase A subunit family amidase